MHRKSELSVLNGCVLWGSRVVVPTNSGISKVGHGRAFALTTAADSFFSKLQYYF